jgi:hypothetical protein
MACVFAACLVATEADFMVLNPADYREHFVEGWPGPNFDGTLSIDEGAIGCDVRLTEFTLHRR